MTSLIITGCVTESAITATVDSPVDTLARTKTPSSTGTLVPTITSTPLPKSVIELPGVSLPPGFSITLFAELDSRPTALAFDQHGNLFATFVDSSVRVLLDTDEDGYSDEVKFFASGYHLPLGITIQAESGDIYLSSEGLITVLRDNDGDFAADQEIPFSDDLPFGLHQNDNLKFGPDGMLYIGVGSTCDACLENDFRSGTILQFDPQTKMFQVYARGLRNPYDLAFHPLTGDLFATDNGRDDLGLDAPLEELNHIVEGANYGWPECWNSMEGSRCTGTTEAIGFFEAHSSANSLDFYIGQAFPAEYQNNLFIAVFGSWIKPNVQTGIMRVILTADGDKYQTETEWFATLPEGIMPLGLIIGPDGALYFGDYLNNRIYRISYGVP